MDGCLLVETGKPFGTFRGLPIRRQHPGNANGHVTSTSCIELMIQNCTTLFKGLHMLDIVRTELKITK
jgi:hypothetical protein